MIGIKATVIMVCISITVTGCVMLNPLFGYHGMREKARDAQPLLLNPNEVLLTEKSCLLRYDIDRGVRQVISCTTEKRYGHHLTNGKSLFSETRIGGSGYIGVEALDLRTGLIKWRCSPSRKLVLLNGIVGEDNVILTVGSYDYNPWRIVIYGSENMNEICAFNVETVGPPRVLCTTDTLYYAVGNSLHAVDLTDFSSRTSSTVNECILDFSQTEDGLLAVTETSLLLVDVWNGNMKILRTGKAEYLLPASRRGEYYVEISNRHAYIMSVSNSFISSEVPIPSHFDMVGGRIALIYPEKGIRVLNPFQRTGSAPELSPLIEVGFGGFDRLCNTSIGLIITDRNGVHQVLDPASWNVSLLPS